MAKKKRNLIHKVVITESKRKIIQQLLQKYDIKNAEDSTETLKDLVGVPARR